MAAEVLYFHYVAQISTPTNYIMSAWSSNPNDIYTGQYDAETYEELIVEQNPGDLNFIPQLLPADNINAYILTQSSGDQATMYALMSGVYLAMSQGQLAIAQNMVSASSLTDMQKTTINGYIG